MHLSPTTAHLARIVSRYRDQREPGRRSRRAILAARRLACWPASLAALCPGLGLVGAALLHVSAPLADVAGLLAIGLALAVAIAAIVTLPESRP